TVTKATQTELKRYHYAEAARVVYDFAWDHFCSLYVEMAKPRLQDPAARPLVQQILAHCLDSMLRLLHPITPFVTEAIWQELARFAPSRDLQSTQPPSKWIIQANWPAVNEAHIRPSVEKQFAHFVDLVGAIREIRSRQNLGPKDQVPFCVRCEPEMEQLLAPMSSFLSSMAGAHATQWSQNPTLPSINAHVAIDQMDVFVDLTQFIDVAAEISRNEKLLSNLMKQIQGKEGRLSNESFVSKAPPDIIAKERQALEELIAQRSVAEQAIEKLRQL
ncbi:MAG: class I tRNA ligase family protein, partial [Pirellula sp.]